MESPYYTDHAIRERIDTILHKASTMMANIGMKTPVDVGSREEAKRLEKEWLEEVKELDHEMYQSLVPQVDTEEK